MKYNMLTNSTHNWAIYKVLKIDLTASKARKVLEHVIKK